MKDIFDVTIIGGGPAGLYSAFYSGMRGMKTKIIEFQPVLGGKLHLYPEKMIWDVGGITPIPGSQLIDQLVKQGLTFNPEVVLNEKIVSIERREDRVFILKGATGKEHFSKTVIVAVGSGILNPQKLKLEGAEKFETANLHYTVKSLKHFKDKVVLISGGGNSAIDWANELEPVAKKVYITYRGEQLKGHEAQVSQLSNSTVDVFLQTSIIKLVADADGTKIEHVELEDGVSGEKYNLEVDEVLINHGFDQDASLFKNSGLPIQLVDDFYIDGSTMSESSIEGLYAAGDILKHEGKLHLIAGAFQDAANAVNKAKKYIEPDASSVAMVSTINEKFKNQNKELIRQLVK